MMRQQGFTSEERQNEILEKILKYGISSINPQEKEFLDSFSLRKEEEAHQKLLFLETEFIFEDDNDHPPIIRYNQQSFKGENDV